MPRGRIVPGPLGNQGLEQNEEREGRGTRGSCSSLHPMMQMRKMCTGPQILPPYMCLAPPTTPYSLQGPRASGHQGLPTFLTWSVASLLQWAGHLPRGPGTSRVGAVMRKS